MKEMKKRRELHNLEWEELVSQAEKDDEKRHVYPVIWKVSSSIKHESPILSSATWTSSPMTSTSPTMS
jgi:hypothetical protein